jgi:protein TonB
LIFEKYKQSISSKLSTKFGFLLILLIVIVLEINILSKPINNKPNYELEEPKELVHRVQFKTIKEEVQAKPKIKKEIVVESQEQKIVQKQEQLKEKARLQTANKRQQQLRKKKQDKLQRLKKEEEKEKKLQKQKLETLKLEEERKKQALQRLEKIKADTHTKEQIHRRNTIEKEYYKKIQKEINKHKIYPSISRSRGQEGEILVSFLILKDGTIKDAQIQKSSGFSRLDKAALKIFKKMKKTYEIPNEIAKNSINFTISISFKLR